MDKSSSVKIFNSTLEKINANKGDLTISGFIDVCVKEHMKNSGDAVLKNINDKLSSINSRVMTAYGLSLDILNRLGVINDLGDVTLKKVARGEEAKVVIEKKN